MNGTQLIRNLNWLGRTNDFIEKMEIKENNSSSVDEEISEDEVNEEAKKSKLLGRGCSSLRRKLRDNSDTVYERELICALPEMNNTQSNLDIAQSRFGIDAGNLSSSVRNMKKKRWSELAHFFNTTSNILHTIGLMTENTILRSSNSTKI